MSKIVIVNEEAKKAMIRGANLLSEAVVSTLGPRSRNVAIARKNQSPLVVHDGVTVARSVLPLKDPFESVGAELLMEASANTNNLAGDGTTTSTAIANSLITNGTKLSGGGYDESTGDFNSNMNVMEIKQELDEYSNFICDELDKMAKKLRSSDIYKIAKISSASDEIAKLVSDAIDKVGKDGLILAGESQTFASSIEFIEGMEFDNGYLSPYFVTDPNRMTADYEDAYVLFADQNISDPNLLVPILEKIIAEPGMKKAFVVIANDVTGFALQLLVKLKLDGKVDAIAIMSPEYADRRKEMLEDLAVLTGGVVYSPDKKDDLKNITLGELGRASVKVSSIKTVITPKNVDKEELAARAQAIREQIEVETQEFRKDRLKYRLAKITQGVAFIKIGGASEVEVTEKRLRVEDAVHAVRAAIAEGYVPGGGLALITIANLLGKRKSTEVLEMVRRAISEPFHRILINAGINSPEVLIAIEESDFNSIYDVVEKKLVDPIRKGIIDPVKVTKLAVKNAFSIAGIFLTTSTVIVDEPEKDVQTMRVIQ